MAYNGPAIWGGCVTRRSIRAESRYPAPAGPENYPGARRVWHVFLQSRYKVVLTLRVSRYKVGRSREFIPCYKVFGGHWSSVRLQIVSKAGIYHGAKFYWIVDARVRVPEPLQICLGGRSKSKNRDKQLTHIVRVSSFNYLSGWKIIKLSSNSIFHL